ncbi:MAG: 16S rRNA (cytosine(967)-C(5))-methyltransferase RsmB [Gammaproteobacteria bacterium]|nr:16S rRNA (cytosine(967)-C(5))-methyltransferase RsmB [Gammaproteobacteria bacterium]
MPHKPHRAPKSKAPTRANPRALAARVVEAVNVRARYLDAALAETLDALPRAQMRDAPLIQEMTYGTLRWFHQLQAIAALFLTKPLKAKDQDIYALLLIGLYQLRHMRVAEHAVVQETVEAAVALKKPWAKDLLNACLRSYLRDTARVQTAIETDLAARYSHPLWLIQEFQRAWPQDWETILSADNERPPMLLRVNLRRNTRAAFVARLAENGIDAQVLPIVATAVKLETPVTVNALPGFAQGEVSVQDAAAQLAAVLLDAQPGERILDACAAPGGKTGHLLEQTPALTELVALDKDAQRVALIEDNLKRLDLRATTLVGDAARPTDWWDGQPFDRILADVPCSASGIVRRHPDIKLRRQAHDLPKLLEAQASFLNSLWPLLKPGGKLLYVTCSILPVENEEQMQTFMAQHPDAVEVPLPAEAGRPCVIGRQRLPGEAGSDGFYYACLRKN